MYLPRTIKCVSRISTTMHKSVWVPEVITLKAIKHLLIFFFFIHTVVLASVLEFNRHTFYIVGVQKNLVFFKIIICNKKCIYFKSEWRNRLKYCLPLLLTFSLLLRQFLCSISKKFAVFWGNLCVEPNEVW